LDLQLYSNVWISRVLHGITEETKIKSKMNFAILGFREHYSLFEEEFVIFFNELELPMLKT